MNNTKLYPLLFIPEPHEKVWGGDRLKNILNLEFSTEDYPGLTGKDPIGESWEISGMLNDSSVVENGFFAGDTYYMGFYHSYYENKKLARGNYIYKFSDNQFYIQ